MTETYYFIAASQAFIESEPLDEVLEERQRNYAERGKPIDFFYVERPAFLAAPEFEEVRARIDSPAIAIVSVDPKVIRWLKLRLEFVEMGEFSAPSNTIPEPLASLPA